MFIGQTSLFRPIRRHQWASNDIFKNPGMAVQADIYQSTNVYPHYT